MFEEEIKQQLTYGHIIDAVKIGNLAALRKCFALLDEDKKTIQTQLLSVIISKATEGKAIPFSFENTPSIILMNDEEIDGIFASALREDKNATFAASAIYFIKQFLVNNPTSCSIESVDSKWLASTIETHKKTEFGSDFITRIADDIMGCRLKAGDVNVYTSHNPCAFDAPSNQSILRYFNPTFNIAELMQSLHKHRDRLSPEDADVFNLWMFSYHYQIRTAYNTDFCDMFYIPWHKWGTPATELLFTEERGIHKRRPVICHVGKFAWVVHDHLTGCFSVGNSTDAVIVWMSIVTKYYGETDEFNNNITCLSKNK